MAIVKMEFISIIGLMSEFEKIVDFCGKSSFFQADNVFSVYNHYKKIKKFSPIKDQNIIHNTLFSLNEALRKLNKKIITDQKVNVILDVERLKNYVNYFSDKVSMLLLEKNKLKDEIKKINENINIFKKYIDLSASFDEIYSCRYTTVVFGKIPINIFLKMDKDFKDKEFMIFETSRDKSYVYIFTFFIKNYEDNIYSYLKDMKFEDISMPSSGNNVKEEILNLNLKIKKIEEELKENEKKIDMFWENNKTFTLRVFQSLLRMECSSKIKKNAARFRDEFIIVGWIPNYKSKEFITSVNLMNGIECKSELGDNLLAFNPPTKLCNKKIFKPFEFFIETYGVPKYNTFDPTFFVAITYTFLFGIMFADLGQGFLLILVGFILDKITKNKLSGILKICGVSSMIFGCIFGSCFGFEDLLTPIYTNVLGFHEKPIEVMKPTTMMLILYSTISIGAFLLVFCMIINTILLFKKGKLGSAIFSHNGVCGIILYTSMIITLIDRVALKLNISNNIFIFCFVIIPVILIFLKEILEGIVDNKKFHRPKNWTDFILTNFFEIFEIILSYFTNTISFIRVGAFIFVHTGLMAVVFKLAEMTGLFYIPVVIFGNILITAFEAMMVGIQVMRLEFYELFSRFYKGSGRAFEPISLNKKN